MLTDFLPTCREDMQARGWSELDILIVSGDAYVDHPAFGPAVIARVLESKGYRVGLIAQPDWHSTRDIQRMGRPRLWVGVSAGNLDSMLNKLTAQKKVRGEDAYSPGGALNLRPNRATIVYANLCRQAFRGLFVAIGGIEASLRRIAHYDYWEDSVRRSILLDCKAELLIFGMAEKAVCELSRAIDSMVVSTSEQPTKRLMPIAGTARVLSKYEWQLIAEATSDQGQSPEYAVLPTFEEVAASRETFAKMTQHYQLELSPWNGRRVLQVHGDQAVLLEPPSLPLTNDEMDSIYDLPFTRQPHPSYRERRIPAFSTVENSITSMRGCFGGCSFCSIAEHEGKTVQLRTPASVLREVDTLARQPTFSGTITDIGGPTANMYGLGCSEPEVEKKCRRPSCLHPAICNRLRTDHTTLIALLEKVRQHARVKHAYVASGVRLDLALRSPKFIELLALHYTGGYLSVAPEHISPHVLDSMRKPGCEVYDQFDRAYSIASKKHKKEQFLQPYFMVGHPGSSLEDTIELVLWLKHRGLRPRQVQEFIPTPMSVATAMYYSGYDPLSMKPLATVTNLRMKRLLKSLLLYWDEKQWPLVREALQKAGRTDLIGGGQHCLVPFRSSRLPTFTKKPSPHERKRI